MQTSKQKAVVRRWVKNLRSGQYKQGTGYLVTIEKGVDKFCCLGVLCDMAVRAKVISPPKEVSESDGTRVYLYEETGIPWRDLLTTHLPKAVQKWAGMASGIGEFSNPVSGKYSLAELNDSGKTFKTIAKVESNPEGLFV